MFELRNVNLFQVSLQSSSMFQPTRKLHSVHENLWLPTMIDEYVGELSPFSRTQKIPHARRNLTSAQAARQVRYMPSPQAQRRMNFKTTEAEANPKQSPTS